MRSGKYTEKAGWKIVFLQVFHQFSHDDQKVKLVYDGNLKNVVFIVVLVLKSGHCIPEFYVVSLQPQKDNLKCILVHIWRQTGQWPWILLETSHQKVKQKYSPPKNYVVIARVVVYFGSVPGTKFDANDDRSVKQNKSLDEPSKLMCWSIKNP